MIDKELQVKSLLAQGKKPVDIAKMDGMPVYSTIVGYRNDMRKEAEENNMAKVAKVDPVALQAIVENLPEPDVEVDFDTVLEKASGLHSLEPDFERVSRKLLQTIELLADSDKITATGVKTLTSAVGDLYKDIFVESGTKVLINNNTQNVSGDRLDKFKEVQR